MRRVAKLKTRDRKRKTGNPKPRTGRATLAEGIIPLDKRGRRSWSSLTDNKLVSYAKKFMKEIGVSGSAELENADSGLYDVLRIRGLLKEIGFEEKQRSWKEMEDEGIIECTKKFMKRMRISGRGGLQKADHGLYDVLRKRGLLDKIGFEKKRRPWKEMRDDEIIRYAKTFIKEKGISTIYDLKQADGSLYQILRIRGLLDEVGFEKKQRSWMEMKDDELIEHAKSYMKERGICGRGELIKADSGLYQVLKNRNLLANIRFEEKKRKDRHWNKMNDEEIIEYAKKFMKEKRISGRSELKKADPGLLEVLRRRGLSDKAGFEKKRRKMRPWKEMKDEEIIEYAKKFVKEEGISRRNELYNADQGLYCILRKRKLLNLVFSPIEKSQSERAIEQIIDFTASFGERR